jgi:hypothetical protein
MTYTTPTFSPTMAGTEDQIVWYVVPVVVLVALAVIMASAVLLWCLAHGKSAVASWSISGGNASIGCK